MTTYEYWLTGFLKKTTDANLHATTYDYFPGGRLQDVFDPLSNEISYTYDEDGNLKTVTDQSRTNVTTYSYWENNQLKQVASPLRTWQYSLFNPTTGTSVETLPSTATVTRGYDQMDRLTSVTYSDSTPTVSFTYDAAGNRYTMTDSSPPATTQYTYDNANRIKQVTRSGTNFSYNYDFAGNLTYRIYPDASSTRTSYGYDDHNRLCYAFVGTSTASCASPPAGSTTYSYDVANGKTIKTLPNAFVATAQYDAVDRLTSLTNVRSGQTMSKFIYTLDKVGNPTKVVTASETINYTYYDNDRLFQVCYDAANLCSGAGLAGIRYTYDGVGNVSFKHTYGSNPTDTYFKYNADNELCWTAATNSTCSSPPTGATTYKYDANGNLCWSFAGISANACTSPPSGSRRYTHNSASQLVSTTLGSTTDTYTYDGNGNRLTDKVNSGTPVAYAWDMNAPVAQLATETQGANLLRRYIYGGELLSETTGGANFFYLTDGMGSVANLTSSTGASRWDYTYEPYGSFRSAVSHGSNPPANPMAFDGEYRDSSTSLYDLRARMYNPGTGGFLEDDPSGNSPSYTFASSRPTTLSDPSGMLSTWGWIGLGLVAVGAVLLAIPTGGVSLAAGGALIAEGLTAAQVLGAGLLVLGTMLMGRDAFMALASATNGTSPEGETRNPAQDKILTRGDLEVLRRNRIDPEELKGGKRTGQNDLYKDSKGNIYVKPKGGGSMPGDPTGINLRQLRGSP